MIDALLDAAEAAAREGRIKQTLVIDARRRVRIDARYGKAKVIELDDSRARKVMGGKDRALRPDESAKLLQVIGIMNADGSISARSAKKYKQVNHFVELCRPVWSKLIAQRPATTEEPLRVLDLGCGNGYLDFVLAEALRLAEVPVRLHGVDRRAELVDQCTERAKTLGFDGLSFSAGAIEEVTLDQTPLGGAPDLVVALHACDTATDDALALAVRTGARSILAAPCCQRELAEQLQRASDAVAPVSALVRGGMMRREYGALLTDGLRVEVLEGCGYQVDVIEFVGSEHTPKNLMLRAHRKGEQGEWTLDGVKRRCEQMGVWPRLLGVLAGEG
ncbi:MAG: SAM-dependent methyltransferase [Myxococcota bacterium]